MSSRFGITALIPGLPNEVALEIFRYFVSIDWDGPFPLVLVCRAWRDVVLNTRSIQSLHRRRRRPMRVRDKAEDGICVVSFDGGGPGSMSQLLILEEFMVRLAFERQTDTTELLPADYFDLMGGVGFGGLVALLLGRLHMTTNQAIKELAMIGTETFMESGDTVTREVSMIRLRKALERMLERNGYSVETKLRDSSENRCKVVLFAAPTAAMDHCHPFRTYRSPRKCLECTLVDAACATMATPEHFPSVAVGLWPRRQGFAGIPYNLDNPTREVLKEAKLIFGEKKGVSLVLSLGAGQRARYSSLEHHVTKRSRIHYDGVARDLQDQLKGVGEYLRLNVDKGMDKTELDKWHELGTIETHTNVYLEINLVTGYIDRAAQLLIQRNGSVTLGQLSGGTSADGVLKFHSETLKNYLEMEFKQMHEVVQELRIEKMTLIDAIGNDIPIPMEFCATYEMLLDVIGVYFRHQRVPGRGFVERGDYRLVHGNRRNLVGPMEWTGIKKVGLKVEMSMVLRTRNEDKTRCPSCHTLFEGNAVDEWAQCSSCAGHFQIENQIQAGPDVQSNDTPPSEVEDLTESNMVSPAVWESRRSKHRRRERAISGEAETLRFRLFSVINLRELNASPNEPNLSPQGHDANSPVTTADIVPIEGQSSALEPQTGEPAEDRARPITPVPMVLPPSLMARRWQSPSASSNHEETSILGDRASSEGPYEAPKDPREMPREVERVGQSSSPAPVAPVVIRGRLVTPPSRENSPTPAPTSPGARRGLSLSATGSSLSEEDEDELVERRELERVEQSSSPAPIAPVVIRGRLVTPPSRENSPTPAPTSLGARRGLSLSTTGSPLSEEDEEDESSEEIEEDDESSDVTMASGGDDSHSLTPAPSPPVVESRPFSLASAAPHPLSRHRSSYRAK